MPAQIDGLVATPAVVMYLTAWDRLDEVIKRLPPERQRQVKQAREWIARVTSAAVRIYAQASQR